MNLTTFSAPPAWRAIDFISDLHLASDLPKTVRAWRGHLLNTSADAVFMLGDLFEVWVGDDARHGPFESSCVDVMREAAARIKLGVMVGNRDFLIGPELLDACSAFALSDPTVVQAFGTNVLLSHGDAWCLGDVEYQQFRSLVRSADWRREFLHRPLAERRRIASDIRSESERRQALGGAMLADVDPAAASDTLRHAKARVLVHGHTHRPASGPFAGDAIRHVLSDWDLDRGQRAEVLRWTQHGLQRISPEGSRT